MHDPYDDEHSTPPSWDTPVRPQHLRETYRATSKKDRRPPPWKPGDDFGQFRLGRLLGQGSSGFVYEAFNLHECDRNSTELNPSSRCALKILATDTPQDLVRNKMGFRHMMKVHNKHLLRAGQVHRIGEYVALSMELIEGRTFAKEVSELRKLDPSVACERVQELLRHYAMALSVMHANYLIHRDIKPQNLMVDSEGNGRLIDYGLVGEIDLESDPCGIRAYLAGTPQYMAPEVWAEQSYLPAGDVYSLGKVVYEALRLISGNRRLANQTPTEFEQGKNLVTVASELVESVPEILVDTCVEMMETHACDRPTAFQVARLGQTATTTFLMPSEYKLYGREEELSQIFDFLDGVLKGQCGRLHISGPSGIGKSRLIQEVTRQLQSRRWLHVFSARCQLREDQPLQAFDQICDALATRYAKEDLGVLEVDPASAAILHQSFPVLEKVVTASHKLPPLGSIPARLDALEAAARVSRKILETGPLILVIDDAQWADKDSLNVLDRLQAERASTLAIITLSRLDEDLQKLPADVHLRLGPLSKEHSRLMLRQAAERWAVDVNDEAIDCLAQVADGCPFRLDELADEFRPNGAFADGEAGVNLEPSTNLVDTLLHRRLSRLSPNARRLLTMIAASGGAVSSDEITAIESVEGLPSGSLDELNQHRLLLSESSNDELLRIVHDSLAQRLVNELTPEQLVHAHRVWGDILLQSPLKPFQAARIAGHLFEAGEIDKAIEYADQAVVDAQQRYALTEAARWHERIIPHLSGDERIDRIRQTAICYDQADLPVKATEYYSQLAELVPGQESIDSELRALALLTQCGRIDHVRHSIKKIAKQLDLPMPKKRGMAKLSVAAKLIKFRLLRHFSPRQIDTASINTPVDQRIRLCLDMSRPLCLLDNLYGVELAITGSILAIHAGSYTQQLCSDICVAVYGCYEPGTLRQRNELALTDLLARAEALGDPRALGECHSAIAASHMLAQRYSTVVEPSRKAIQTYKTCHERQSFVIAHTQYHLMAAFMQLGRIGDLQQLSQQMYNESITRNDFLGRVMASSGAGSCGWLAAHELSEFDALRTQIQAELKCDGRQYIDFTEFAAIVFRLLYEGRWEEAEAVFSKSTKLLKRSPCADSQLCRAEWFQYYSLVRLNLLDRNPTRANIRCVRHLIGKLRKEGGAHCDTVADLHEAYLCSLMNQPVKARHLFIAAERQAAQLELIPLSLAAIDAIDRLKSNVSSDRLHQYLRSEGVVHPELFANLYAVQPKPTTRIKRRVRKKAKTDSSSSIC